MIQTREERVCIVVDIKHPLLSFNDTFGNNFTGTVNKF